MSRHGCGSAERLSSICIPPSGNGDAVAQGDQVIGRAGVVGKASAMRSNLLPNPNSEPARPTVVVVDDDPFVRGSMDSLFRSVGYRTAVFGSAQELLAAGLPDGVRCLVLDVRLPHISGLDFQAKLSERGENIPIVFVTGHGDIPMSVQAMKSGAIDFLAKPFRDQDMLDAVSSALMRDRTRMAQDEISNGLKARYETLSARERQVMAYVTSGLMNKQVAGKLDLSEITIKLHRGNVMRKMDARTLADLVRMAEPLGLNPQDG